MNYCPFCGTQLDEEMLFCPKCGKQQPAETEAAAADDAVTDEAAAGPTEKETELKSSGGLGKRGLLLLSLGVLALIAAALFYFIPDRTKPFADDSEAITKASASVVKLNCVDRSGQLIGTGSGFAVFDEGVIVTNYHVIEGDVYGVIAQLESGMRFELTSVLAYDEEQDIAILGTDAQTGLELLPVGDADALQKGDTVVTVGSPQGFLNTVSTGTYSGDDAEKGVKRLRISAPISPGSSGGALFNNKGEVVGITTSTRVDAQNLNFAVPIGAARELYDNRDAQPLSFEEFYDLGEHIKAYDIGFVLAHRDELMKMEGSAILIKGYIALIYEEKQQVLLVGTKEDVKEFSLEERFMKGGEYDEVWDTIKSYKAVTGLKGMRAVNCENAGSFNIGDEVLIGGNLYCYNYNDGTEALGLKKATIFAIED